MPLRVGQFRISDDDRQKTDDAARRHGVTRSDYIRMRLLLPCSMIKVPCANDIGQMLAAVGEIGQRLRRLDLRIQNDGGGPYHIALLDLRQEVQELRLTLQRLLSS